MHILVADDDDVLRTELAGLLRDSGYTVSVASDGPEVLERLRLEDIDVVLLDLVMPGTSGFEVLRQAHAAHPATTFIMVTGHGTVDVAVEAMKAGASEFLQKPFDFDALEGTLRALGQKLRVRKELARLVESIPAAKPVSEGTEVVAVLLSYMDGTLIGSRNRDGEAVVDQDLLVATLNLIQGFMRTSFPFLRGETLRTIVQGRYRLLIDSGDWTYLTVVIPGSETPDLRASMHGLRVSFERENEPVLVHWGGRVQDVVGVDRLLEAFFAHPGGTLPR